MECREFVNQTLAVDGRTAAAALLLSQSVVLSMVVNATQIQLVASLRPLPWLDANCYDLLVLPVPCPNQSQLFHK